MLLTLALTPAFTLKAQTAQTFYAPSSTCVNLSVLLQVGSRDYYGRTNVSALQAYLYAAGYLRVAPTGYFGGQTLAALKSFQRNNGIYPTGTTNAQTRTMLRDISCGPVIPPAQVKSISLQLKNPSSVYGPNSTISFTWTSTYNTQYPFGAYVTNESGTIFTSKYLGVRASGEDSIILPTSLPSGTYTLRILDDVTVKGVLIKSNQITFQVNGGINPGTGTIRIISPNGSSARDDVFQGGQQTTLTLQIPSDKAYYIAYYLVPQSGTAIRTTNGTTYDSSMGGYSLGGFQYNYPVSNPSLYIAMPSDVYTGKYKLKVVLREVSTNVGVNSNPIIATDESDYAFMLYTYYQDGAPASTPLTITSPNGGENIQAGGTFRLRANAPTDKVYSFSYYLIPQSGTPIKTGSGTYYDSVSGGYSLGGFTPTSPSGIDATIAMPTDVPAGSYRLRVYLRNKNETAGSPTAASAISYDDSNNPFTVTSPNNGGTAVQTLKITSPNSTGVVWNFNQSYTINWTSTNMDPNTRLLISLRSTTGEICAVGAANAGVGSFTFTPRKGDRCSNSYSYTSLQPGYYLAHITTEVQTMIYPSTAPVDTSDEYFQLKEGDNAQQPVIYSLNPSSTYVGYNPTVNVYGKGFSNTARVIIDESTVVTPQYISAAGDYLTFKFPSTSTGSGYKAVRVTNDVNQSTLTSQQVYFLFAGYAY